LKSTDPQLRDEMLRLYDTGMNDIAGLRSCLGIEPDVDPSRRRDVERHLRSLGYIR
jgi:hypothetical protein